MPEEFEVDRDELAKQIGEHQRLTGTDRAGSDTHDQSWSLDGLGNMSSVTTNGSTENRTHNSENQLTVIGAHSLAYDDNGNLTKETYTDLSGRTEDWFKQYAYNIAGQLTEMKKQLSSDSSQYLYYEQTAYESGAKTIEVSGFEPGNPVYKTVYFNTGSLADSAMTFGYSTIDSKFSPIGETYFHYSQGRVTESDYVSFTSFTGTNVRPDWQYPTLFTYGNGAAKDKLTSVCHTMAGYNAATVADCTKNNYNADGTLASVYNEMEGAFSTLLEDYRYSEGRLDEKRIYTLRGYEPGNKTDVTLIKYSYP